MRIIVFFDLPTETPIDKRNYRKFRKTLINNGFFMMQESVYCRMVLNMSIGQSVINILKANRPPKGCVEILTITEKQFSKIEFITGKSETDVVTSDERLIIL